MFRNGVSRPYTTRQRQKLEKEGKQQRDKTVITEGEDTVVAGESTRIIVDDYSAIREKYLPTRYPIVLCHGLLGFDKIKPVIPLVAEFSYFRGIGEALTERGAKVIAGSVLPAGSIAARAQMLYDIIMDQIEPDPETGIRNVNLIGHSMGGLDARYLASNILKSNGRTASDKTPPIRVLSLTSVATPHRGSPFADAVFATLSPWTRRRAYRALELLGVSDSSGFEQLTTDYMVDTFNPTTRNDPDVFYYSYGARFQPGLLSSLRLPWKIIKRAEGDNDGMVSVHSAMWGRYIGTLENCDHLDVINLSSLSRLFSHNSSFSAVALYLHIMDRLAKRGF